MLSIRETHFLGSNYKESGALQAQRYSENLWDQHKGGIANANLIISTCLEDSFVRKMF